MTTWKHGARGAWRRRAILAGLLGSSLATASSIHAQAPRWELNLSGARIQYDSLSALNAPSGSGLLEWRGSKLLGRIGAGVTGFQNAGWTAHGAGELSRWFSPTGSTGPLHLEISGAASGSKHSSGFDTYFLRGNARAHASGSSFGGWLGLGLAHTRTSVDPASVRGVIPSLGAWARSSATRFTVTYEAPEVLERRYHEVSTSLAYSGDRLDLTGFAGWRAAPSESALGDESWLGASAAFWLRPEAALVVSGGRYAPDVIQGLPGGDYVSVGFRITGSRARPVPEPAARSPLLFTEASATRGSIGFELPEARTVEVAGDWNDWTPEPLSRDSDGRWVLPPGLAPGVYRFNLRVDGERWIVPEGVPSSDDGFGGEVGLLVITGDS
ncbi:MAG: glycogen-binding domain-containing protein [Gemmatimonadota bacterium]|nr:glycogen-binding domain-containing protein [Gemmatimonadota bacterium]